MDRRDHAGGVFYLFLGALTLLAASVPHLYGWLNTPPGHVFSGFTLNIDDSMVYLAWMRQVEDGRFFLRNQFTSEPQRGVLFNLLFWLLGTLVRLTSLPAPFVYHAARVGCGALLLRAVVLLLRQTLAGERARKIAFALVCVSSGVGWVWNVFPLGGAAGERLPIDLWQTEAITFTSLYFSPLFLAALALMVVFVRAALRAEQTGKVSDVWPAALAGALLGNFHSYDVIALFAVWGAFRIGSDIAARRVCLTGWAHLALVLLATIPTVAYQGWALRVEPVFFQRAFATRTDSAALVWVAAGYGLVGLLALLATLRPPIGAFTGAAAARFLLTWAVVGVAVSYVPVSFQRKLLMGAHLPLCTLAGALLARLTERLPGNLPALVALGAVLMTVPSNLFVLGRDLGRLGRNEGGTPHRPYLTTNERSALLWLRKNTRPSEAVLVAPDPVSHLRFPHTALYPHLSVYVPALAGNVVYNGHWSETANFGAKIGQTSRFFRRETPDAFRQELLRENNIRYVLFVNALASASIPTNPPYHAVPWPVAGAPFYLKTAYENADITLYRVILP